MYQNENQQFYNGIEYKLLKIIAEKEHLDVLFQNNPIPWDQNHQILR